MKAGVAFSKDKDSFRAGEQASGHAAAVSGQPALALVFTTDNYDPAQVLSGVKAVIGPARIAGFCCAGVITAAGVHSQGVGVMALSGGFRAVTTLQKGLSQDPFDVGQRAGLALLESGVKGGTAIVMPDGFQSNVSEMLRALYNQMGPDFRYTGGGAGDNLKFFRTYQFTEREIAQDALAVVLLEGVDTGIGIGHGWTPTGDPLVITRVTGKRVHEIDGVSAFSAYSSRLAGISKDQFSYQAMMHPLGFPNISGQYIVRDPLTVNEDESIDFVTEIPSQAVGYVMECAVEQLIETARAAARQAVSSVPDPAFMLLFDCISRAVLMGERFQQEINALLETVGPEVPMLGALTFGEVGGFESVPLFHNKTAVVTVGSRGHP